MIIIFKSFLNREKKKILLWFFTGIFLLIINNLLIYFGHTHTDLNIYFIILFGAVICNLLRFFINNYIVFNYRVLKLNDFIKYQISSSSAFTVSYCSSSLLIFFGIHYLVANNLGIVLAMFINLFLNFFWVWRK